MTGWRRLIASESGIMPLLLALMIAAAGLISVGVILLNRNSSNLSQGRAVAAQLAEIEKAIRARAYPSHRLPCPANGDGDGAAKTSCTGANNDGVVPWATLGLSKQSVTDPFGRLISYSVDPDLAAGNFCSGTNARAGSIHLNPSSDTSLLVLVSHGPTGFGGWLPIGRQSPIPPSALERENCADSAASAGNITCADPDRYAVTQGPYQDDPAAANFFDDSILAARSLDYKGACAGGGGDGDDNDDNGIPDHCEDGLGNDDNSPACD